MRQGLRKSGLLFHEGVFFGMCLGADFCAEHENGITDLKNSFGIIESNKPNGIANLKITQVPKDKISFFSKGQSSYLLYPQFAMENDFEAKFHRHPHDLVLARGEMAGAWSDKDFGIHVKGKLNKTYLQEIYDALLKGDIAFGFTSKMPVFDNAGLCLFIVSKFPKVHNDSLIAQQEEKKSLQEAADKTGLIAYLDSKGKGHYKGYYSCIPKRDEKSADGLKWWFNSYDQKEDGYGHFYTQELKDWADGKEGNPISKKNEVKL